MNRFTPALTVIPAAFLAAALFTPFALAQQSPQEQRHELMEGVGDAAKPVGAMLKGEAPFDAATVIPRVAVFEFEAGEV